MAYFNWTEELSAFIQFSHSEGNNRSMAVHSSQEGSSVACLGPASGPPVLFAESSSLRKVKAVSFFLFYLVTTVKMSCIAFWLCCTIISSLFRKKKSQMLKSIRTWFQLMTGDLKWCKGIIIHVPPAKCGNMRSYLMSYCRKPNLLIISAWRLTHSISEGLECLLAGRVTPLTEFTQLLWLRVPGWDRWPSTPGWRSQTAPGTLSWTSCRSYSRCCKSFWGLGPCSQRAWAARPCCLKWWRWRRLLWGWWCNSCRLNSCCLAF